jgi:nucleoid DNA-binding protein
MLTAPVIRFATGYGASCASHRARPEDREDRCLTSTAPLRKTQLLASLSESTGLPKKDVAAVLDELGILIERHIKKRAVGTFTLPGLLRIMRVRKPATKARTMISPRTGEEIQVAAKPASTAVKVRVLAGLKRMVE